MRLAQDRKSSKANPIYPLTESGGHSGQHLVNSMFNVEIPHSQPRVNANYPETSFKSNELPSMFPHHPQGPVMTDRSDAPTPYPSLIARFTLLYLNAVTLQCIGLAIGVALFSSLLQYSLHMASLNAADSCVWSSGAVSLPATAAIVRDQTYSGVNATIWNMKQTAIYGIETTTAGYRGAAKAVCEARNEAARNATQNMAEWASSMIQDVKNTTETLFVSLQEVGRALESSGYFNGSAKDLSNAFNVTIPTDSHQTDCNAMVSKSVPNSTVAAAFEQIELIASHAQGRLATIMDKPIPSVNISHANNTGAIPHEFGVTKATRAWVIFFSVAAVLSVVPAGYKEYYRWHYQLTTEKELQSQPQFDFFETVYRVSHYGGALLAEFIARNVVRSGHHTRRVWAQWAWNYSFSSNLSRLLQSGIFLALFAIANSTLISNMRLPPSSAMDCSSSSSRDATPYLEFQRDLNQDLFSLISQALEGLDSNQLRFSRSLQDTAQLDIAVYAPFGHGIGLEEVITPPSSQQPQPSLVTGNPLATVTDLLKNINSALWIASLVLFAIWALFAVSAFGWAIFKAHKTKNSYGANQTPANRI